MESSDTTKRDPLLRGWTTDSVRASIVGALNYIQKLTIPRSQDWEEIEKKKKEIAEEEDLTKLLWHHRVLAEVLLEELGEEIPAISVETGDQICTYKDLEHFFRDTDLKNKRS